LPNYPTVIVGTLVGRSPAYTYKNRQTGEMREASERLKFLFEHEDGTPDLVDFGVYDFDKAGATFDVLSLPSGSKVRLVGEVRVPSRDAGPDARSFIALRSVELLDAPGGTSEVAANGRVKATAGR
jgi:hypothetical protein